MWSEACDEPLFFFFCQGLDDGDGDTLAAWLAGKQQDLGFCARTHTHMHARKQAAGQSEEHVFEILFGFGRLSPGL